MWIQPGIVDEWRSSENQGGEMKQAISCVQWRAPDNCISSTDNARHISLHYPYSLP